MDRKFPNRLANDFVALEVIDESQREALRSLANDPALWRWFPIRGGWRALGYVF